ncbi:MAG: hypothetical protein EXS42_07320 [Lacunisphaera sp.]|nr:hypothetical protein [Lacunisphaera sp.]
MPFIVWVLLLAQTNTEGGSKFRGQVNCAFELQGTRLTLPNKPGIGVTFNREAAKQHPADMTEPPHFHREDGSYTNY